MDAFARRWENKMGEEMDTIISAQRKYAEEMVDLACWPDLQALRVFPNFKEVTESFGAYAAVRRHLRSFAPGHADITMVAVGDGATPRTAATFAFRTRWQCISVDPAARTDSSRWLRVDRLTVERKKIEELVIGGQRVVIVAVHSHADLRAAVASCAAAEELAVVSIPCCVPQVLGAEPDAEYQDHGIASPERTVKVWRGARLGEGWRRHA